MSSIHQATVFIAHTGEAFAFIREDPYSDGDVAFSPDGEMFYALASKGSARSTEGGKLVKLHLDFEDPAHHYSGKLQYDGLSIEFNGVRFVKQDQQSQITVVPLPATRRVEYFCKAKDGTIIYVGADKYNYSYGSFRLFIGNGAMMRGVPVKGVDRYRDGGTTYIRTPEETFFSPAPSNAERDPNLVPMWGELKLTNLNPDGYNIVEINGKVTLSKR